MEVEQKTPKCALPCRPCTARIRSHETHVLENFIAFVTFNLVSAAFARSGGPPNVVIMFCDDLGYADVGSFGAKGYKTPHLDRMAREGVRLTNFHVASAVCSASRIALLTGCYNTRVGIRGALGPKTKYGINKQEMTIAELTKQKGFATAIFGKWHLGHLEPFLPTNHGFDEYFGIPYSNDMWPYHPGVRHLPLENGSRSGRICPCSRAPRSSTTR